MANDTCIIEKSISETLDSQFPDIKSLKEEQKEVVLAFIQRKDVFAVLPTGWGKSLCFQLIPPLCSALHSKGLNFPAKPIVIVVCPLKSLVESHIKELESRGIKACSLSSDDLDEKGILAGEYSFVLTSPESILDNEKWRNMLRSKVYQDNIFGLVIDEAHVVPKWGQGNKQERRAAFRECFGRLGDIRSLLPIGCPVLALTATATKEVRERTAKALALSSNITNIYVSPNRPNIYLYKLCTKGDSLTCFNWLIEKIKQESSRSDKTLIYCRRQTDCGMLFCHFLRELGCSAYYPDGAEAVSRNCLIGMYHANTLQKHKDKILAELLKEDGVCRVVFATTALGMGINIPDVKLVIHYGPPREADDFIQEIGRAGRDGSNAHALLFYCGKQLRKCDKSIKEYAQTKTACMRQIILKQFGETTVPNQGTHLCCVICHSKCTCGGDTCIVPLLEIDVAHAPKQKEVHNERKVSKGDKELLKELLSDYQKSLACECPSYYLSSESTTGFTDHVISSTVKNAKYIFTMEDVQEYVPVYCKSHATEVLVILSDVFNDIRLDSMGQYKDINRTVEIPIYDLEYGAGYCSDSSCSSRDSNVSMNSVLSGIGEL